MSVLSPSRAVRTRSLDPAELAELTRLFAADVRAGAYPFVDLRSGRRWHRRLYRDRRVDVWLLGWLPSHATALHDHGGSSGAFTVVSGVLSEVVWRPGGAGTSAGLVERVRPAGSTVRFGERYVHDVRNTGDGAAVSVHAYSAPLTSMTYYEVAHDEVGGTPRGPELRKVAHVAGDDPEAGWDG